MIAERATRHVFNKLPKSFSLEGIGRCVRMQRKAVDAEAALTLGQRHLFAEAKARANAGLDAVFVFFPIWLYSRTSSVTSLKEGLSRYSRSGK